MVHTQISVLAAIPPTRIRYGIGKALPCLHLYESQRMARSGPGIGPPSVVRAGLCPALIVSRSLFSRGVATPSIVSAGSFPPSHIYVAWAGRCPALNLVGISVDPSVPPVFRRQNGPVFPRLARAAAPPLPELGPRSGPSHLLWFIILSNLFNVECIYIYIYVCFSNSFLRSFR